MVVTLALLLVTAEAPIAVPRLLRGEVVRMRAGEPASLFTGMLVHRRDRVEVGRDSWVELALLGDVRVRLSASTQLEIDGPRALRLVGGRVWILRSGPSPGAPFRVEVGPLSVQIPPACSVVLERRRVGGVVVAARAGRPSVDGLSVEPGWLAERDPLRSKPLRVRPGGATLAELVSAEARGAREDPARLRAFLVARARAAALRATPRVPGGHLIHRARDEVVRTDSGPTGARLEDSLRPPPFFEREIPPVGPNVRVEVEFE